MQNTQAKNLMNLPDLFFYYKLEVHGLLTRHTSCPKKQL